MRRRIREPAGLYISDGVSSTGQERPGLELVALARDGVYGHYFGFHGLKLAFLLRPPPFDIGSFLGRTKRHPGSLTIDRTNAAPLAICFGWSDRKAVDVSVS